MILRKSSYWLLCIIMIFCVSEIVQSQLSPEVYPKVSMLDNDTLPQGAWGMDLSIEEISKQPRYDLSLWSTIGFPAIMTPCSYMYPIVISVKNLNYTFESNPITFSCNHAGLTGPIWISTAFGSISVNQTSTYYAACNLIVDYLNNFEPSMIQTSSAANFTFFLPGKIIGEALETIVVEGMSTNSYPDPVLTWIQQHYYSENWVNVGNMLNLANSFTDMVVLTFKYKIDIPSTILPDSTVVGTNPSEHYYVDLFNMTISSGKYDQNISSKLWQPNNYYAGFQPPVINSAQGCFIAVKNNVTIHEYNSAVPFGWTNTPLGVSPIRVILPSNLPPSNDTNCVNNYLFYYPMDPFWNPNNKTSPYNLAYLKSSFIKKKFNDARDFTLSRNTILTSMYFSKRPFLNAPSYEGQLQNTLVTYLTFSNNFLGGCFYNGTFPYNPLSSYRGEYVGVGMCGTQIDEISTQFKSPYYLPPIKYLSSPSPVNYFFVLTSLIQYTNYSHKGNIKTDDNDINRIFKGSYPGNGILHSLLLASPVNQPYILYNIPTFVNYDTSITLGSSFYQFSERYINRNYGLYGTPGSGMTCRAARFVPMKRDMYSLKAAWQCKTKKTPSSDPWQVLIEEPRNEITSCDLNSEFITCLNKADTQAQFIGMVNTSPKEYVTTLEGSSFKNSGYLAITLTMFTDTMSYTRPNSGKSSKLFSPPISDFNAPEYCVKIPMIPSIPTPTAQVFIIYPTVKPWDYVHNTKYSFLIPFNKGFKIRHQITLGKIQNINKEKEYFLSGNLYCESIRKITGTTNLQKISISEVTNMGGSIIVTTKYPVIQNSKFSNCINQFIISESNSPTSVAVSYETLIQSTPTVTPGEFVSIEYGAVDYPPTIGKLSLFYPDEKGVSIGDSIFLTLSNLEFSNAEQDNGFSSFGIIASSSQIVNYNSSVIPLGDSLSQLPTSIRLPAITKEWFVYIRAQTVSNSGCYIPCQPPFKMTSYSHWCTNDLSLLNAFPCPYSKVVMKSNDTLSEIENAIAVVTHPLAYTSLIETIHIVRALFEQPIEMKTIWENYFDSIYSLSLELQNVPRAYDFSGYKFLSLELVRKIMEVASENPQLKIDISRPFDIIMNMTLNAECTNNPGVTNIVLEIVDLLIYANNWTNILENEKKNEVLIHLLESVGNRFSFWSYEGETLKWQGTKSDILLSIMTIDEISAKKSINIDGIAISNLKFSDLKTLEPVESIYFHAYPEEFDSEMISYASNSCPNISATILSFNYPRNEISKMLINNAIKKIDTPVPIGGATLYLCSIDYYAYGAPTVTFNLPLSFDIPVNMTNFGCAMLSNTIWREDLCISNISPTRQESKQFVIECSCQGLAPYALVANLNSTYIDDGSLGDSDTNNGRIPVPPMNNRWDGISGNLTNLGMSQEQALEIINSTYSGFIYLDEKVKTSYIPSQVQKILEGSQGIAGLYTEMGRSQYITNISSAWGLNSGEAWFNSSGIKGGDANSETFLSWEPVSINKTNNNRL